jgi:hypothetical protein
MKGSFFHMKFYNFDTFKSVCKPLLPDELNRTQINCSAPGVIIKQPIFSGKFSTCYDATQCHSDMDAT